MLLIVWVVLIAVGLVLIGIGLAKPNESAQALIGFFFLFLLGLQLLNSGIDYKIGENETYIYGDNFSGYHWDYTNNPGEPRPQDTTTAYIFHREMVDHYGNYQSHDIGLWLCIGAGIGFAGVLYSLGKTKWGKE